MPGKICPGGVPWQKYMEQVKGYIVNDVANTDDLTMETYNILDRFLEQRLFPVICVAVPVYLMAHIIVMLLR